MLLVLTNNDIENDKKISVLKQIDKEELKVCAPGIYTHLNQFVSSLTTDSIQLFKEKVIKAHTLDFIKKYKASGLISEVKIKNCQENYQRWYRDSISKDEAIELILEAWEIHYANALMDAVSEEFGLYSSEDSFTEKLKIDSSLISEFKRVLKKYFVSGFFNKLGRIDI